MSDAFDVVECPDRDAWLKERRSGIGASEAAAVLGASPWKTAVDLWAEKVGIVEPPEDETEWLKWGRRLEPAIVDAYMEETGRIVIRGDNPWRLLRSTKHPFLLTTLDGEIVPIDDRGPGVFEGKTAVIFKKDEWSEEPPIQYQIQNQHQLLVTRYLWGGDAVLIGGSRFLYQDFTPNPEFQDLLLKRLETFWELVVKEQPPSLDGSESAKELLRRLYPKEQAGKIIALPPDALTWDRELLDTKESLKVLKAREDALKAKFMEALGDAERGVLPGGDGYTLKAIHKEPYTVKAQDYRELRRFAARGTK